MPSIINANTSGGLISTADTSGVLQLQTASTAALTINASQQVQVNTGGSASAPVISKSDDTNTGIFFPAADTIAFAEGGTESMRIDSSGNVGVNNTSPAVIASTTQVAVKANVNGNSLFVAQNSNGLTTAKFGFQFTGGIDQPVVGTETAHPLVFMTNNTDRLRIPSDASGIQFPATQVASSNANTLDDYEEGTWTPTDTSGAGLSFSNINAQYTKIGRMVYAIATFDFPVTANGSNNSIGGLPFTVGSTSGHIGGFITNGNVAVAVRYRVGNGGTDGNIRNGTGTAQTNASLSSGNFTINALYFTS